MDFPFLKHHPMKMHKLKSHYKKPTETLTSAKVLFENPKGSMPVISYSFEPLQDSLYVRIRILIESPTEDTDDTQEFQLLRFI